LKKNKYYYCKLKKKDKKKCSIYLIFNRDCRKTRKRRLQRKIDEERKKTRVRVMRKNSEERK